LRLYYGTKGMGLQAEPARTPEGAGQ